MNLLVWDGERHVEMDYNLFKHLCMKYLGRYTYWENRINERERFKEIAKKEELEYRRLGGDY